MDILRIAHGGPIGMGTTTPTKKLDVPSMTGDTGYHLTNEQYRFTMTEAESELDVEELPKAKYRKIAGIVI